MGTRSSISGTSSFREILLRMGEGDGTLAQLAEGVGLSEGSLRLRLDHLQRYGYVERVVTEGGRCAGGCPGCCSSSPCNDRSMAAYRITEKGKALMQ